jgi:hypothetical protein
VKSVLRLVLVLLAVAICNASVQAKLGLYHPETSPAGITSKVIKLAELRLDPLTPDAAPSQAAPVVVPEIEQSRTEPPPVRFDADAPRPPVLPRSHWFRPPPAIL